MEEYFLSWVKQNNSTSAGMQINTHERKNCQTTGKYWHNDGTKDAHEMLDQLTERSWN